MSTAAKPLIIPHLSDVTPASPHLSLLRVFCNGGSKGTVPYGLLMNFIRIADIAVFEYELGREAVSEFWNTRDRLATAEIVRATGHFEFCLTSIKRCLDFFDQLKRHSEAPNTLKALLDKRRAVYSKAAGSKVTDVRNAIEHLVGDIGTISDGQSLCLKPEADGLVLADHQISYKDLGFWLRALNDNAHALANYNEEDGSMP